MVYEVTTAKGANPVNPLSGINSISGYKSRPFTATSERRLTTFFSLNGKTNTCFLFRQCCICGVPQGCVLSLDSIPILHENLWGVSSKEGFTDVPEIRISVPKTQTLEQQHKSGFIPFMNYEQHEKKKKCRHLYDSN